jgi:hypothetical protein
LIYEYIETIKLALNSSYEFSSKHSFIPQAFVFITTPINIQEIPHNMGFEGLNKPKNIVKFTFKPKQFNQDNGYRAGRRHIMLAVRTNKNELRKWDKVKRLILHEISHTLCNHVTYRTKGNHLDDFKYTEKTITKFVNSNYSVLLVEEKLKSMMK